jgi:hypothetical protein
MKKQLLILLVLSSIVANAQYFEGFESGFPGSMTLATLSGTGIWQNCGGDTGGATCPLTGTASATFYLGSTAASQTTLTTPILDLSTGQYRLTFNLLKRVRSSKNNFLNVEFSSNGGTNWTSIGNYYVDIQNKLAVNVLLPVTTSNNCKVRFKATNKFGYAIILDDINITPLQNNDAAMTVINNTSIITIGNTTISGTIKNQGINPITNVDICWQVDAGTIYTQSLTGLTIAPDATYNYSHSDQWNATSGQHLLKVWVINTNGGDQNGTNDLLTKPINVVNAVFPRTVLYEEATGSWCQWCPRGHVGLKDMEHNHQDGSYIGIAVHNNDPMVVTAYNAGIAGYISGYPSGAMDRTLSDVDSGLSTIQSAYFTNVSKTPLAKISLPDAIWNATTREITFTTTTKFALDLTNANYNVAAIIVENGVTGTTSSYNQANAYAGGGAGSMTDWEGTNWATLPSSVPAAQMVYDHVGRALLGGFTGFAGSIPAVVTYNTPIYYSFSHILPTTQNINNIEIVTIIIDNATGQIVNVGNFDLGAKVSLATNTFAKNDGFAIYPNPSTGIIAIKAENTVQINVTDVLGKVVFSASNVSNNIDLSELQKGIYFVKISDDTKTSTQKLILK